MRYILWLLGCIVLNIAVVGAMEDTVSQAQEAMLDITSSVTSFAADLLSKWPDQKSVRLFDQTQWHRKVRMGRRSLLQTESLSSDAFLERNEKCLMILKYKVIFIDGNTGYYLSNFALGNVSSSTNVTDWKLGVTLPEGDYVRDQAEVLGTNVRLLRNGTSPIFGSSKGSYITEETPVSFDFVQSLGINATRPLPAENVVFNNLICELGRTDGGVLQSNASQPKGELVELTYLPVQYRNRTFGGSQFVFKLKNVQEYASIRLEDLKVLYYFHGLDDPPERVLQNPGDFFEASCRTNNASTLDCSGVNVDILPGYENVTGAQFIVEVTFGEDSGQLLPQPAGRGDIFIPGGFESSSQVDREIFIALQPNAFAGFNLNDTMDYSYEDTPEVQNSLSDDYIQRYFADNIKMTVYFQDTRIWGIPPGPEPEIPGLNYTSYVCSNGTQCEFTAEYCCSLIDPCDKNISSTAPTVWPPEARDINNLTCPDGSILNKTDLIEQFYPFDNSSSSVAWVIGLVVGLSCGLIVVGAGLYFWRNRRISSVQTKDGATESSPENGSGFDIPDASELSWVIPIHKRLGGSDIPTSEPSGTPISSRQSSALLTNNALTVESKLMRTVDSRGQKSGTTEMGSPKSPKLPLSPVVPGYMGVALLPPNIDRLIDNKCETISGRINGYSFRAIDDIRSGFSEDDIGRDGQPDDFEEFALEDWQMKRSKSWDGLLMIDVESDSRDAARKIKRRRESKQPGLGTLPPLSPTPIPMIGDDVAASIDLHVPASVIEKYLGKSLGTGGFGAVYQGKYKGMDVAVKKLPPFVKLASGQDAGQAAYEALIREIKLASKFDCDRLVKVYGACTDDKNKCCLIMELMTGGNLYQRIHDRNRRRITYIEILQIVNDIAEGLAYLHPFVIHRDLKPQNILLDKDGRAKIADFGISKVKDPSKTYLTQMTAENGTPMYMSPEQMNGGKVDEKVDVYALGCIMNEMWTRRQPWKNTNHFFQIILKVAVNGDRPWVDPETPEPLKRLIKKCWHQDPHQRPSCAEILRRTDILIREELDKWDSLQRRELSTASKSSSNSGNTKQSRFPPNSP